MIASLPMYDRPENAAAHDALWAGVRDALRARGVAAPEALDREIGLWEGWTHPGLVLGQTCGLPYRTRLHGKVRLVATFDYGLPGTPPGYYRSVFVARADDARDALDAFDGAVLAYNQRDSHSGWAAPQTTAQAFGIAFRTGPETGAHRASARAVAEGQAEITAIDAITWRGIERWEAPLAARLKVVDRSGAVPALPLITATPGQALIAGPGADPGTLFAALAEGFAALAPEHRATLGILGLVRIPAIDYLTVPTPPGP